VPEHTPLVQSAAIAQPMPVPHVDAGAHEPPQSTPVSVPFIMLSVQLAAGTQTPALLQVPPAAHEAPVRGVLTGRSFTHSSVVHSLESSTGDKASSQVV
jgi:tagatose-1,6-bisphosphate aldolase